MESCELDRRVTLQRRSQTRNATGELVDSFADYAEIWAKKEDLRGREYFAAQQIQAEVTTKFTIRWRSDFLMTDRISLDGMFYNIRHRIEIGRRKWVELLATAPAL